MSVLLGEGIRLPEWDYRKNRLIDDYCLIQPMLDQRAKKQPIPNRSLPAAKKVRAQFETLKPERQWLRRQPNGEDIDLDAWLGFRVHFRVQQQRNTTHNNTDAVNVYRHYHHHNRDLCCLLLADLSMSTEAHVNNDHKVIDVIRDSMLLFSEALSAVGDPFALYGFHP